MKRAFMIMALLSQTLSFAYADNQIETRGIGQYPGHPSQFTAPKMVKDDTYRNIALNRMVYTSSNADFNLTGHLVTDGIISSKAPSFLRVKTNEGELSNRDKEKMIDGNIVSSQVIKGENAFVEFNWEAMKVNLKDLKFTGELAYYQDKASEGYAIRVMASHDGKKWELVGEEKGAGLPGEATKQQVSSDPNKFQDVVRLPLRKLNVSIPMKKPGNYGHVRIELSMPGAAWWRIKLIDNSASWRPSAHFSSVWKSALPKSGTDAGPQWLYVDLGTEADFDQVNLYWVNKARSGKIQVSADAKNWIDVADLGDPKQKGLTEEVACKGHGRYVRLLLTEPDASGHYALSEMQVMGKGGLHAEAANTLASSDGKQMLNQWQLRREGSDAWIEATVPGTVLTSYMNIGAVPDNRFDDNMRQISESFFNSDFWYRTNIEHYPSANKKQHTYLNFDGINWKAEVMLNGEKIGRIDGAFIRSRFDVTNKLKAGTNKLEVHVIKNAHFGSVKQKNLQNTDLNGGELGADNPTFHASIGWDWITSTPGREIGIWNDVYLTHDNGVRVYDPVVTSTLNLPDTLATMTPSVFLQNADAEAKTVKLTGHIGKIQFEKEVNLKPMEKCEVSFAPADYPQLKDQRMNLWWPNGYGVPYLYDAGFKVTDKASHEVLSEVAFKAGIRQMSYADLDTQTKIYINGKRLNPLGGNWGFSETNLNYRGREYDVAVRYHKEMNYNMIRDWVGQIGDEELYEACDKYGIMIWQDFWLANPWDGPDPYDETMFLNNSEDYISRIRNHACIGIYCGRNEGFPPASIDKELREQIKTIHPQLGYVPSSADLGVSGHGPYQMKSSSFYFANQSHKLHSERGMPNVPSFESLSRMMAPEHLWPQSDSWGQHDYTLLGAQGGASFNEIMEKRYGKPQNEQQFTKWAQWLNYDGYRAMYESAGQERLGLLIWMSHSCWPSMVWCTYDYYFEPTAAYFGVKKACEPLHIQYNPVKKLAEVVNFAGGSKQGLLAKAQVLDMYGKLIKEGSQEVNVGEDQTVGAVSISEPDEEVYYLKLTLMENGEVVSDNFYVMGKEEDNLQALAKLPMATIAIKSKRFEQKGEEWQGEVEIRNTGTIPALLIRLNLKGGDGEQILPVIYSDNYFSLMPNESKKIKVSYRDEDGRGQAPYVEVSGFNQ